MRTGRQGGHQGRERTAGADYARHQRMAPRRRPDGFAVGDVIRLPGDGDDGTTRPRQLPCGVDCRFRASEGIDAAPARAVRTISAIYFAGKRKDFRSVAANRRRPAGQQFSAKLRAVRQRTDRHWIERPRHIGLNGRRNGQAHRGQPRRIERADVNQQRAGVRGKCGDFLLRDDHRRRGAGRQQHVGADFLNDLVGQYMDERRTGAKARQFVGSDG